MISAQKFINEGSRLGYDFYSGVPCSFLKPLINFTINHDTLTYVAASNEGDATSIASGAYLGGKKAVALFQNSGLGNAINPLTSLNHVFKIPILIIVTLRGELGVPDEPQHELMGDVTTRMLDEMKIPWEYFPKNDDDIVATWRRASQWMDENSLPYALVMKKNSVKPVKLTQKIKRLNHVAIIDRKNELDQRILMSRKESLQHILDITDKETDIIIASTGYNSRELYALDDRQNHFYMVGSMGCASSIGLGLSMAQPNKTVYVIEGDGAMLMRMGSLATIGFYSPRNLKHIVLDNEAHESTGSQSTVTSIVDLAGVAYACGYVNVISANTPKALDDYLVCQPNALSFLQLKISPGVSGELPRPSLTPEQVKARFVKMLNKPPAGVVRG